METVQDDKELYNSFLWYREFYSKSFIQRLKYKLVVHGDPDYSDSEYLNKIERKFGKIKKPWWNFIFSYFE